MGAHVFSHQLCTVSVTGGGKKRGRCFQPISFQFCTPMAAAEVMWSTGSTQLCRSFSYKSGRTRNRWFTITWGLSWEPFHRNPVTAPVFDLWETMCWFHGSDRCCVNAERKVELQWRLCVCAGCGRVVAAGTAHPARAEADGFVVDPVCKKKLRWRMSSAERICPSVGGGADVWSCWGPSWTPDRSLHRRCWAYLVSRRGRGGSKSSLCSRTKIVLLTCDCLAAYQAALSAELQSAAEVQRQVFYFLFHPSYNFCLKFHRNPNKAGETI